MTTQIRAGAVVHFAFAGLWLLILVAGRRRDATCWSRRPWRLFSSFPASWSMATRTSAFAVPRKEPKRKRGKGNQCSRMAAPVSDEKRPCLMKIGSAAPSSLPAPRARDVFPASHRFTAQPRFKLLTRISQIVFRFESCLRPLPSLATFERLTITTHGPHPRSFRVRSQQNRRW